MLPSYSDHIRLTAVLLLLLLLLRTGAWVPTPRALSGSRSLSACTLAGPCLQWQASWCRCATALRSSSTSQQQHESAGQGNSSKRTQQQLQDCWDEVESMQGWP
jgi:hypothetical protein